MSIAGAANMALPTRDVRDSILAEIQAGATRPTELLNRLGDRFPDFEIKEGLLRLLQEGLIELTSDRHLKLVEAA